jgi:cytochrome c peroxidase
MTNRFFAHSHRALAFGLGAAAAVVSLVACSSSSAPSAPSVSEQVSIAAQGLESLAPAALQQRLLGSDPFDLRPLSREPVPQPTNGHIINQAAAVRLGKAFFWDIQAGSDGQQACGACHASFGTDHRTFNTINPGGDGIFDALGVTGVNQTYTPGVIDQNVSDDAIGTQGVATRTFVSINPDPHIANENCNAVNDAIFGTARRVEFRQAPMIFGAAFMKELFWAGEASEDFNGLTIWGLGGNDTAGFITQMGNSALASQATGPIANSTEMRCTGRPINGANSLGAKMLARPPLQFQRVSTTDSVLGHLANPHGPGLVCHGAPCNYRDMIAEAFGPTLAAQAQDVFSMLWGESIQAYESTLIPDETPFDKFLSGRLTALTPFQVVGLVTFLGKGNCSTCHNGPFFSDATVSYHDKHGDVNSDGGDQGFHNIGLVNNDTDGGRGVFGVGNAPISHGQTQFDDWAFKTPTLRNVKLSAPYFHHGVYPTLEDVVDFYDRGGDAPDNPQISAQIKPLHLSAFEKTALVDFMRNGLTDCRVEKQRAPFDHPEIQVPNGDFHPAVGAEGTGRCP